MDNSKPKYKVKIFAFASFLNDMGSDMIYPIWPLFLSSFIGVNMAIIGLIDGIGDAIVSISQAFSGYLSDKLRKRKVFIILLFLRVGDFNCLSLFHKLNIFQLFECVISCDKFCI